MWIREVVNNNNTNIEDSIVKIVSKTKIHNQQPYKKRQINLNQKTNNVKIM